MKHILSKAAIKIIALLVAVLLIQTSVAQTSTSNQTVLIHAHNDYYQTVPFFQAYAQQVDIIEVDVFYDARYDDLMVAHDAHEITQQNTLEKLYIKNIVNVIKNNNGKVWKNNNKNLYLLIDIKNDYNLALKALINTLEPYEDMFDTSKNKNAVTIVISGNMPAPNYFENYPNYIHFDGRSDIVYSNKQLQRIAFVSDSFTKYSKWNGKGSMIPTDKKRVAAVIENAHKQNKKIRFWGTPDNVNSWQTFRTMGVDIINTDKPEKCADFFRNEHKNNFSFAKSTYATDSIKTKILDKTTASFKGFSNNDSPESPISIYTPTGLNDGASKSPKNIIFMIGDGMGIAQLSAADLVNGGLSMSQIKYMGMQRTQPKGSFITDSAGAGSALATGEKTNNRNIATDALGNAQTSITETMIALGKQCGIATNGNIADATPAAFYAHAVERDNADEISAWLLKTKLNFLAGSGESVIVKRKDGLDLKAELIKQYQYTKSIDEKLIAGKPAIIIDEKLAEGTTKNNLHLLALTTNKAINHLSNKKGFFLVVEGAKIDYAGHANSVSNSIIETLGFDLAVQAALRFADSNGETLVIVTGDHETGGLTIIDGSTEEGRITGLYTTDDHTPVFLPIFAYGPGAKNFIGLYNNTDFFERIKTLITK